MEFVEYVNVILNDDVDLEEIEDHLSLNGYKFGIDRKRNSLFVFSEEFGYVVTILEDRSAVYEVEVY